MSDVLPWLEYRWSFDFPAGMFRAIYERWRGSPSRLEELLKGTSRAALIARREGHWPAQEDAGHLWILEELWLARIEEYQRGETQLSAADMSNRKTFEADFNRQPLEEILRGFRKARVRTMQRLDALTQEDASRAAHHPRINRSMRLVDLCYFAAEHDDHHLAVIQEILRRAG